MTEPTPQKAPMWQRVICGLIGLPGLVLMPVIIFLLHQEGKPVMDRGFVFAAGYAGLVVFSYIAVKGKLPSLLGGR